METNTLQKIAHLTDINNHTEARILIAIQYPYLEKYEKILKHIKDIHEIERCLPYHLAEYRDAVSREMMEAIAQKEGEEAAIEISRLL